MSLHGIGQGVTPPSTNDDSIITNLFARGEQALEEATQKLSAEDCNAIGLRFFSEQGVRENKEKAKKWFDKGVEKGSLDALVHRASLYQEEKEWDYNLLKAIDYYSTAMLRGQPRAREYLRTLFETIDTRQKLIRQNVAQRKRDLKVLTSLRIKHLGRDEVKAVGIGGNTLLHMAARTGRYMDCARLLTLGANPAAINSESKTALSYLSADKQKRVSSMQNELSQLIEDLATPVPQLLGGRVTTIRNPNPLPLDIRELLLNKKQWLSQLCDNQDIAPLMELAKLAACGLHDMSRRNSHREEYDSDEEDDPLTNVQKFSISIDGERATVEGMYHYGANGLQGREASGVYPYSNEIYVGGLSGDFPYVIGVVIHELTHFVAQEIFQNQCRPYFCSTLESNRMKKITEDLQKDLSKLDTILQGVFRYYEATQFHAELIVRVPQMIVTYQGITNAAGDGLHRLTKLPSTQALLDYYRCHFLPIVKAHTRSCRSKALRLWSEVLIFQ